MYEDLKFNLCCGARTLFRNGLHKGIAGHLSIKVGENTILANRFGPSFRTLVPSDILTLDLNANILEGKGFVNETIRLHCVLHKYNPKINAIAHTHSPGVLAFSSLRIAPLAFDQHSCLLAGEVAVIEEGYDGFTSSEDRVRPIGEALSRNRAVIMPNHGSVTWGGDIKQAIITMMLLEEMVKNHMAAAAAAQSTGLKAEPISPKVVEKAKQELNEMIARFPIWQLYWDDLMSELKATDPELFSAHVAC